MKIFLVIITIQVFVLCIGGLSIERTSVNSSVKWDESEITGYHFHTYFFQNNQQSKGRAYEFYQQVHREIESGTLDGCTQYHFYATSNDGPHPIGNFAVCCNASALSHTMSWFMQNRANHSVLLHPLTRYEIIDHTDRAMFLGPSLFLDLSYLEWDRGEPDRCEPYPYKEGEDDGTKHFINSHL